MQKIFKHKLAFFVTLVPLILLLFVSCSSAPKQVSLTEETTEHLNAAVEKTIAEPERAIKLKQLGQQLIDVSSSIQQDVEAFNQQAIVLNENYDTTH